MGARLGGSEQVHGAIWESDMKARRYERVDLSVSNGQPFVFGGKKGVIHETISGDSRLSHSLCGAGQLICDIIRAGGSLVSHLIFFFE